MENENRKDEMNRFDIQPEPAPVPTQEPYSYESSTVPTGDSEPENPKKHMGLAIASLVLGGLSILCCSFYGLTIIPGIIGAIFGLICVIKGKKSVRIMGAIGLGLGLIGIVLSIIMIVTYVAMINWDAFTMENFQSIQNIDPNNKEEVYRWMQQFFNVDIMSPMGF